MSRVRVPLPTPQKEMRDRECPGPSSLSTQGCRQVVRQGTLTPSSAGSSPAIPATDDKDGPPSFLYASLAQSAEHLPFKQGVRGSNPRRGTKRGRYLLVSSSFAVLPLGSRSLYLLPAESAAGLFSLRRQLQQGLFIVSRSVQHGVQQILQRITDLSPPQPQRHQVAALHRQVLQ